MSETDEFKIRQIIDNGKMIQLSLVENVSTEPISQKQIIKENIAKILDADSKKHVIPLLDAILQAQPTIRMKSYMHTEINITMPKSRYECMGHPQVGHIITIDIKIKDS